MDTSISHLLWRVRSHPLSRFVSTLRWRENHANRVILTDNFVSTCERVPPNSPSVLTWGYWWEKGLTSREDIPAESGGLQLPYSYSPIWCIALSEAKFLAYFDKKRRPTRLCIHCWTWLTCLGWRPRRSCRASITVSGVGLDSNLKSTRLNCDLSDNWNPQGWITTLSDHNYQIVL